MSDFLKTHKTASSFWKIGWIF